MALLPKTLDKFTLTPGTDKQLLQQVIGYFRTSYKDHGDVSKAFIALKKQLSEAPEQQKALQQLGQRVISDYNFFSFFSQYSLLDASGFGSGIWARLKNKIIPRLPVETDIQHLIHDVLDLKKDPSWIKLLPKEAIQDLFTSAGPSA